MKNILTILSKVGIINFILALGFIYFAIKVYLFNGGFTDKIIMVGIICCWIIWFLMRHMLFLVLLLALVGGGAYIYYTYNQKLQAECEQSGGVWNSNTKMCEEKVSLSQRVQKIWENFKGKNKQDK